MPAMSFRITENNQNHHIYLWCFQLFAPQNVLDSGDTGQPKTYKCYFLGDKMSNIYAHFSIREGVI